MEFWKSDVGKAVIGWAIPAFLAWLVTKLPGVREWLEVKAKKNPDSARIIVGVIISVFVSTLVLFAYDKHFLFPGPKPIVAYKCPVVGDTGINAAWVSHGCIGQLSANPQCVNQYWAGGYIAKPHDCDKIGTLRYDEQVKSLGWLWGVSGAEPDAD